MSNVPELELAGQEFPRQMEFWQQCRTAWAEPTALVRDHLREHNGNRPDVTVSVPERVERAVRSLTGGCPLHTRALGGSVLALLAAKATDRDQVTVFLPVTTEGRPQDGGAVPVPVTATMSHEAGGQDLLDAVRDASLAARANLDVPLHALLDAEGIRPTDLMLAVDTDLTAADAEARGCPLLFDLRLAPEGEPAQVRLAYDARLFSPATARRLAESFVDLLDLLLKDPAQSLRSLLAVSDVERSRVLGEFNSTAADFPDDTLHGFLEEQAAVRPGAVAVTDNAMTYAELNAAANRLARTLRARGVGAGDVVGVCVPRSPDMLVAVYAVLKAGGAYLPVDPSLPANRIEYILDHSGTPLVLVTDDTAHVAAGRQTVSVTDPENWAADGTDLPAVSGPGDLAYVIYTSGSTGRPKGVMIEHRAIVNRLWWMQRAYPLGEDDVILHKTPFTFDVSVWEIFWWSLAGASVATLPSGDERDPQRLARRISEAGVTTMHFVPSMLHAFLQYTAATTDPADLSSLRRVFASGEALAVNHTRTFTQHLGSFAELVNLYGPTEAAVDVTYHPCSDVDTTRSVPIGRPIDNIRLYVRTRSGALAPVGTPGELCIAGTGLARGYLNAPDLTRERFVPNPFERGGLLYTTGDLARWLDDGTIEYLGRLDTQVKIRGYRIELGEIEHVAAACAGVTDCAVTTTTTRVGLQTLVAYVVAGPDYARNRLREALAAELPSYMVPQHIIEVDAIPTTHNGKRDLKSLPDPMARARAASRGRN
ncbi:amino acid adenylation domain-containing protein [Kitasatospora sp. NPDC052896]|uniref:amino acid adenylation domain-containing protein n=1 Tax=Kitasatospora sp. NPDC052896 TaxID=3364061 RepID=UPI0037C56FB4